MSRFCSLAFVAVFAWTFSADGTNWHASQIALRRLYELQAQQLNAVKTYLASETERLQDLERTYSSIKEWFVSNSPVKSTFILNHLNGAHLMKRILNAQLEIKLLLNDDRSMEALKNFYEKETINDLDLMAVYRSLRRLQKVYAIPASDMAAGRHKNRIVGDPLDACECYAMVKFGYENADMFGIVDWMVQAYRKWLVNRPACVDMNKLHNYMKFTSVITGYSFKSLPNFQELHHSESTKITEQYMSLMEKELFLQDINPKPDIYETYDDFEKYTLFKNFRHLCKTGESKQLLTADFKCRYQTKNDLYRIIMPFKEEDISHDPYLKLYHDVIFEEEIKFIIDKAEKDLSDAAFYNNGKISLVDDKRLGQLKWFSESVNPQLFNKLNNRVECLTGFSTKTAEGYQTVNYGVGGHFSMHVDAFTDGPKLHGNRLITVLFYMTDVVDDGYTIFPKLNYVAHCRKGTAMIWRNLYLNNGTVHSGTYHGGCPVLKGNKWIMTKGLYEGGQPLTYDWKTNRKVIVV